MLQISQGQLLRAGEQPLVEDSRSSLSYDQLFRRSDPKRIFRSAQVRGPPLEIDAYKDAIFHTFNFKSYPSTTGLRHRGYIKFQRPTHGRPMPAEKLPVVVDCTCPDFRYRWAWANRQRGASRIGSQSLNQCIDRAPRITNPGSKVGLCKHLLAARNYIYGLIQRFDKDQPAAGRVRGKGYQDMAWKLDQLVKYANKRWTDWDNQTASGLQRQRTQRQVQQARNVAGPMPAAEVPRGIDQEVPAPLPPDVEAEPNQAAEPRTETPPPGGENQTREESRVVKSLTRKSNVESMRKNLLTESKSIIEALQHGDERMAKDVTDAALAGDAGGAEHQSELPPPPAEAGDEFPGAGDEMGGMGDMGGMGGPGDLGAEGAAAPEDEALGLLRDIAAGITRLADEVAPVENELGDELGDAPPEEGAPGEEGAEGEGAEGKEGKEDEEPGVPPVEDEDEFTETMPVATGA